MKHVTIPSTTAFYFSLIAFLIAALSLTGIVLKTDLTGRVIWGVIWGLIGVGWLLGIVRSRRKTTNQRDSDHR